MEILNVRKIGNCGAIVLSKCLLLIGKIVCDDVLSTGDLCPRLARGQASPGTGKLGNYGLWAVVTYSDIFRHIHIFRPAAGNLANHHQPLNGHFNKTPGHLLAWRHRTSEDSGSD